RDESRIGNGVVLLLYECTVTVVVIDEDAARVAACDGEIGGAVVIEVGCGDRGRVAGDGIGDWRRELTGPIVEEDGERAHVVLVDDGKVDVAVGVEIRGKHGVWNDPGRVGNAGRIAARRLREENGDRAIAPVAGDEVRATVAVEV